MTINISTLGHVVLRTPDLGRALAFYRDTLGLHEVAEEKFDGLVLAAFSGNDWEAVITRPDGTKRSRRGQLELYAQFMLIFLAKATVYTRAQNRDLPPSLRTFVG